MVAAGQSDPEEGSHDELDGEVGKHGLNSDELSSRLAQFAHFLRSAIQNG